MINLQELETIARKYNDILKKISFFLCDGNTVLWYSIKGDYIFFEYYDDFGNDHQKKFPVYEFLKFFEEKPKKEEKKSSYYGDFGVERDERDNIGM